MVSSCHFLAFSRLLWFLSYFVQLFPLCQLYFHVLLCTGMHIFLCFNFLFYNADITLGCPNFSFVVYAPCFCSYDLTSLMFECKSQALDTFNTAVVSPIYYVMFTSLTILASVIMFKVIHIVG